MADETPEQQAENSGGAIFKLAIMAVIVVAAAGGGFATYRFVLAPMLTGEDDGTISAAPEEFIPAQPVMVDLDENYVNVIMPDKDMPASTLLYAVTLECNNQTTADLVMAHLPRFIDMVSKLHDSRTRSEVDDIQNLKASIQREARQKANDILRRLQPEPHDDIRITNVFHRTLMVDDKI